MGNDFVVYIGHMKLVLLDHLGLVQIEMLFFIARTNEGSDIN